jgi:hypothetical protein
MEHINNPPYRITDIVGLKKQGAQITCSPCFEILPVDFTHRDSAFQAFIFLCRYSGTVEGKAYSFRKCYARGCPHNLCPHVAQAVMIANRYLQKDYRRLKDAGLELEEKLFSLDDMIVKFKDYTDEHGPALTIDDYITRAKQGNPVSLSIDLEYVLAVEHFANHKNSQTFLHGNFMVTTSGKTHQTQRCLSCYPTEKEEEIARSIQIANKRLTLLYKAFDQALISYEKRFFE